MAWPRLASTEGVQEVVLDWDSIDVYSIERLRGVIAGLKALPPALLGYGMKDTLRELEEILTR